jgi:hypothetical protein
VIPAVFLVGLGPIGLEVARALVRRGVPLAGAADPAFAGADLGELAGGGASDRVFGSAAELYAARRAEVAILCTGSRVPAVAPQIEEALAAGLHVVTSCEELAYPALRHPDLAARLDAAARAGGRAVAAAGVNPGFVMDRLPLFLASACVLVERVLVERVVDAARRRGPLRAKVGAGLDPETFRNGVAAGRLGHVGLAESAAMVAAGLGWPATHVPETIEPVVGDDGLVLGVRQTAAVWQGGRERVRLELEMSVGAREPHDRVVVDGDPPLDVRVEGGVHGDRATVGTVVSLAMRAGELGAGLVTSYR